MKFGRIVLYVITHRSTEWDFRFDVIIQDSCHDVISRRKVLLSGERKRGISLVWSTGQIRFFQLPWASRKYKWDKIDNGWI